MFKRFNSAQEAIRRNVGAKASRLGAGLAVMVLASPAFAQETSAWESLFAAIGLSGIAAGVLGLLILVIGIAMTFKGSDLSKRVIRKV